LETTLGTLWAHLHRRNQRERLVGNLRWKNGAVLEHEGVLVRLDIPGGGWNQILIIRIRRLAVSRDIPEEIRVRLVAIGFEDATTESRGLRRGVAAR